MKSSNRDNLIKRMTHCWESVDKLYDKILPMYRTVPRNDHKYDGLQSAIKKTKKEIAIMKTKASATTRLYNRQRKRNRDFIVDFEFNDYED